jgi:mannose-6-phosphate isomerase-like protein (cupin superfamily)
MPKLIVNPSVVAAAGTKSKIIEEFVGRVSTGSEDVSIARMRSPEGWTEPYQTPEFDEYTFLIRGTLVVESEDGEIEVNAGQAVVTRAGERVRYSTPHKGGAEYVAICIPAFSPKIVHREF